MATKPSRTIPPGVRDPSRRWISNKVMQDRIQILKYGYETTGAKTEAVLWCKPGGGPPLHYHLAYSERFTARTGNLIVYVDGTKHVLTPGESATVKQGQVHRFTAEGDEEIEFSGEVLPSHPGLRGGCI
ncbi:uncharacterized protein AB675_7030 [Cyphellophora attinorum]|uniref:Cupin type-2 domain-containing protein n=1 Tax=Cyphellophora attinorum TaxID=1664694 RepID=A0A0N1P0N0_9EURO|nr:uncharacterized protein AB675_7030 [Phialophora attinorum]KPI43565.1 hypothetical protein AB675_7030 [Phialophora attinorum]